MNNEVINKVQDLSKQLGVEVDELYPLIIRQSYIDGVFSLLLSLATLVIAGFVGKKLFARVKYQFQNNKYSLYVDDDSEEIDTDKVIEILKTLGITAVFIFFFVFGILRLEISVSALLNPQWYAIQKLI